LTAGLLGDNYIEIAPMYSTVFLTNGNQIQLTRSAMILEKLIGQLIYRLGSNSDSSASEKTHVNDKGGKASEH
jgi:phospholipid/cholesterol/gamma-HCH transport system substrate-binding protein